MKFGDYRVEVVSDCEFRLDGGAMFGVVPRNLWSKACPPDEQNRIRMNMNCLFIEGNGERILIDTGIGEKWSDKHRAMYGINRKRSFAESLRAVAGVGPDDITIVINTHLHFDHAGGNTSMDAFGKAVPAFPNARYFVSRAEYENAEAPSERDRASYFSDRFVPITEASQWQFVDGDVEILPGISVMRIPGHNADIQAVKISGRDRSIVYVADLIPTRHHLPLAWVTGYDLYPLQSLETKRKRIAEIVSQGWIVAFGHDPDYPAATLHDRNGKIEFEPVEFNG